MIDWFSSPEAAQLGELFLHFMMLSLLAVGGAITTAPDMHRYLVGERHWLTDEQFSSSIALAQAAPGPNVIFVPVLGFNVAGVPGAIAALVGIMIPSTTLALYATRWSHARRDTLGVRAFVGGLAPMTVGLTAATGWLLLEPSAGHPAAWGLSIAAALIAWRTRITPIWMIAVGAGVGLAGWI